MTRPTTFVQARDNDAPLEQVNVGLQVSPLGVHNVRRVELYFVGCEYPATTNSLHLTVNGQNVLILFDVDAITMEKLAVSLSKAAGERDDWLERQWADADRAEKARNSPTPF